MGRIIAALLPLALAACGGEPSLTVTDASYRAPLADGGVGVAYFSITSSIDDRITDVSSPQAETVEMHSSTDSNGMASMQKVEFVELPAGQTVAFRPGGLHLMVIGPHAEAASATFPIQIVLESGRTQTISFQLANDPR